MAMLYTFYNATDTRHDGSPSYLPASLPALPADILFEIANFLNTFSDRLHLSATCKEIYPKALPSIYAHVQLQGLPQCEATLQMLKHSPDIARHVQSLVIRPEYRRQGRKPEYIRTWNNPHVASVLVTAAAPKMDALQSFVWDGEDTLPDDRMWDILRNCPNLKHIGTTFGSFLPSPHSHLFNFRDLEGFSLVLRDGFYAQQLHVPSRESNPVFNRLWDMLVTHSPDLKYLTITGDGSSSEPIDITRLASATWPQLCSLTFGSVSVTPPSPTAQLLPATSQSPTPLVSFIDRHVNIKRLSLHGRPTTFFGNTSVGPGELGTLDGKALPGLCEFSGSLDHLRALAGRGMSGGDPNVPVNAVNAPNQANNAQNNNNSNTPPTPTSPLAHTLRTIRFPSPIQLRDLTPLAISSVLGSMHALRNLSIGFWLQSGYDSNGVLRTIVSSCPGLERLELVCGCKPSFYLESFSRTLRTLTKLTSLSLTIVKVPGDEPMHIGASRIALSNPRLHTFTITYLPPSPSSSPSPPSASSAFVLDPFNSGGFSSVDSKFYGDVEPLEVGHYELVCDPHGIPVSLICWERKRRNYIPSMPLASLYSIPFLPFAPLDALRLGFGGLIGIGGFGSFGGLSGFGNLLARLSAIAWRSPLYPLGVPSLHPPPHHMHVALPVAHSPLINFPTFPSWTFLALLNFFSDNTSGCTSTERCCGFSSSGRLGRGKRWVCELRPSGHPDVPKKTWAQVLMEKGPAGEEARLLAICACLMLLAVWGIGQAVF
ncbi:unnamed protein product [Somion occarium]|uniref:F-box domain-containing protein n=1 Tax=Somion occarium TaxID=3059160 RepID=A0ABP1DI23_9APHY